MMGDFTQVEKRVFILEILGTTTLIRHLHILMGFKSDGEDVFSKGNTTADFHMWGKIKVDGDLLIINQK